MFGETRPPLYVISPMFCEIPDKVENMTSRSMLIWDNNPETMKAYTTKIPMK